MSKVVWITGASSGIGEALVYEYYKTGAQLIISGRNRNALFKVKANCNNAIDVHVLAFDLNEINHLENVAQQAIKIYGRIDVLINCAGISQRGLALGTGLNTEQQIMNTNFWAPVILSKAVLPVMIAHGGGHLVLVSSLVGKFGTKLRSAYAASKHALHGYFDSLRCEVFDQNIYISLLCPGFIKTNISINALTESGQNQGTMDDAQAHGMPATACAQEMMKAIKLKKEEVYIGGKETKAIWLRRFFPKMFAKRVKKAKVT